MGEVQDNIEVGLENCKKVAGLPPGVQYDRIAGPLNEKVHWG